MPIDLCPLESSTPTSYQCVILTDLTWLYLIQAHYAYLKLNIFFVIVIISKHIQSTDTLDQH